MLLDEKTKCLEFWLLLILDLILLYTLYYRCKSLTWVNWTEYSCCFWFLFSIVRLCINVIMFIGSTYLFYTFSFVFFYILTIFKLSWASLLSFAILKHSFISLLVSFYSFYIVNLSFCSSKSLIPSFICIAFSILACIVSCMPVSVFDFIYYCFLLFN